MKMLLGVLFVFLLILSVLLCFGLGLGFLLHWVLPTIELGIATLIGIIAIGISIRFISGLMPSMPDEGQEDEEANQISEKIYLIEPPRMRRPRKRKMTRQ
jgi:divalent metal cation (Fe/Co/Zn/Cd) transporter